MTDLSSGVDPTPQPPACSFCDSPASHSSGLIRDELYCCEHAGCEPHAVPVGHDNPPDDVVEIAAKAIFEVEYPRHSPDASADSNRWSWSGDGTRETLRDECRAYGAAVLAAVVPVLEKQLRGENDELRAKLAAAIAANPVNQVASRDEVDYTRYPEVDYQSVADVDRLNHLHAIGAAPSADLLHYDDEGGMHSGPLQVCTICARGDS